MKKKKIKILKKVYKKTTSDLFVKTAQIHSIQFPNISMLVFACNTMPRARRLIRAVSICHSVSKPQGQITSVRPRQVKNHRGSGNLSYLEMHLLKVAWKHARQVGNHRA